jgi:chorismate-pyruvate lyase
MLVYNERLKRDAFLYELTGQLLLAEAEKREDVLKRLRTDNPKKNQALLPPESKKDDRYWVREIRLKGTGPAAVVKCSVRILPNTLAIPIEREVTFAWDPSREVWRLQEVGWPTNS